MKYPKTAAKPLLSISDSPKLRLKCPKTGAKPLLSIPDPPKLKQKCPKTGLEPLLSTSHSNFQLPIHPEVENILADSIDRTVLFNSNPTFYPVWTLKIQTLDMGTWTALGSSASTLYRDPWGLTGIPTLSRETFITAQYSQHRCGCERSSDCGCFSKLWPPCSPAHPLSSRIPNPS